MGNVTQYNILIIDDNPFPTRECCRVLIEKFCNYFKIESCKNELISKLNTLYYEDYNKLSINYSNTQGKHETFTFGNTVSLTVFNYNPTELEDINQVKIIKLIKEKKINIFWTDKGYSDFEIYNGKLYGLNSPYNSNSVSFYSNQEIICALKENRISQIAMYSFNPNLTYKEIDKIRKFISDKFNDVLLDDDIYMLETSPILNLYKKEDWLSSGNEVDNFLGTLNAYKYYGKLMGSVLFDLFIQLPGSKKQDHYNFFDSNSRNFLRHLKIINKLLPLSEFKVGMVSFYGKIFGIERYIIDSPYKEYYNLFDNALDFGEHKIEALIQIDKDVDFDESERWMYLKYKKTHENNFKFDYKLHDALMSKEKLVAKYLPLLHTSVFYEPDFYTENDFLTPDVLRCNDFDCENYIEIFYLFKKVNYGGIDGVAHIAVWRRVEEANNKINLEKEIDTIWEKHYRLVKPKLEATLVGILQEETKKQALTAAIAQIFARNFAHNIGSHVAIRASNRMLKQRILELY